MARVVLSAKAEEDVAAIASFTIETFGVKQARRYRDGLKASLDLLSKTPLLGRDYGHVRPGLRRFESRSHSIYYMVAHRTVRILRTLHAAQDPARHL